MDKSTILIVDDDPALLQALPQALNLRLDGVEVQTSDSALEALKLIRDYNYDAIVSDIKMPGMDGLALLEKIGDLRPDIPTLLITGHGEHDLAVRALRGGAYDFIQKPIDRDYLVAALKRAIQAHQLRTQVFEQQLALKLHAKALERMVQKRTQELVEANAAKDKLLRIISHELKTPLTSLKGMTQLLYRQSTKADSAEVVSMGLEDMERSLHRMEVLVNDLLDTSLIETNMFVLHRKRCDLVKICRNLIDEYTAGTGPSLTFEIPGEPVEVEVDADRIGQVIINLLTNARKYSAKGSPITVILQQVGYEAIVSVRDMGIGIPAEMHASIFEPFFRVPDVEVQTGSHTGLGLGLYISRKIIERHGGHIDVESAPENGSTFSVVLPLYVDPTKDEVDTAKLSFRTQGVWTIAH
ncbi:MAG: hybrid sensor histidine kinase/response regulator [Chloroflexi bacterium]|nr:MAG: hybrid sensor histidine kinase/response regulator [Chloroflexota bacterium]